VAGLARKVACLGLDVTCLLGSVDLILVSCPPDSEAHSECCPHPNKTKCYVQILMIKTLF